MRKQDLNKNWSNLNSVLLESLPKNLQENQKEWLAYHWNLVVGKEIAAVSLVEQISRKTLYVKVKGSEWSEVLESLKKEIIQRLNRRAGKLLVEKIKLTV